MIFKTGVKNDGTITARSAELLFDGGGYQAFKPQRGVSYGPCCLGPYKFSHARVDSYMVYTNHVPCGSMRAPGDPQTIFAGESQIDLIARELGIDPYEFRLKNVVRDGDASPMGHRWRNVMATRTLEAAARDSGYLDARQRTKGAKKVGRGMAVSERHVGAGTSTAKVSVSGDGSVTLFTALPDTGSGFYTVLRQILGQELGVPYDEIDLVTWSTDDIAFETGVGGSRVTHVGGQAVQAATQEVRRQLVIMAADLFGRAEGEIQFANQQVSVPGRQPVSLADLVSRAGGPVEAEFTYESERAEDLTVFSVHVAQVEVDEETGEVTLTGLTSANDVGTILNPLAHQGQIDVGVMQGIGYALMEELKYEDGRITTLSFGEYKIPTSADIPDLSTVLVPSESGGPTPYGGKAIGEQPVSTVAPAIANAVLDAVGVSIPDLPITSEKVFRALAAKPAGEG